MTDINLERDIPGFSEENYNEFLEMLNGTPVIKAAFDKIFIGILDADIDTFHTGVYTIAFMFWINGKYHISQE